MPQPTSGLPFDDIRHLLTLTPGPDTAAVETVRSHDRDLIKPAGSLGRMEEIVAWLAAWQAKPDPTLRRPLVCLFAADHGVAARDISLWPVSATRTLMETASAGGAAINQICATFDLGLKVFDLALDHPTPDIAQAPALDEAACAATMAFGMEAVADGADLLCLGAMGLGADIVAAAIAAGLFGGPVEKWVGEIGDAAMRARACDTVGAALALHRDHLRDPLELLRRLGGRDFAAMAGAILAARLQRIPVLLDGYAACAAAAILHALDPGALDHCMAGHRADEGAHGALLDRIGLKPLLDLNLRHGEGTGAALAAGMARAALAIHRGMATFDQAKVARKT